MWSRFLVVIEVFLYSENTLDPANGTPNGVIKQIQVGRGSFNWSVQTNNVLFGVFILGSHGINDTHHQDDAPICVGYL